MSSDPRCPECGARGTYKGLSSVSFPREVHHYGCTADDCEVNGYVHRKDSDEVEVNTRHGDACPEKGDSNHLHCALEFDLQQGSADA